LKEFESNNNHKERFEYTFEVGCNSFLANTFSSAIWQNLLINFFIFSFFFISIKTTSETQNQQVFKF